MKELDDYFSLQKETEDLCLCVMPIDDSRECFWLLTENEKGGNVRYSETSEAVHSRRGGYYENSIYAPPSLPKRVYRDDNNTVICVDTHTDGKFLQVFSNDKEIKYIGIN